MEEQTLSKKDTQELQEAAVSRGYGTDTTYRIVNYRLIEHTDKLGAIWRGRWYEGTPAAEIHWKFKRLAGMTKK